MEQNKALMEWLRGAFNWGRQQAMLEGMMAHGFMGPELWAAYLKNCEDFRFRVGLRTAEGA